MDRECRVVVTGGSGLVGKGIEAAIQQDDKAKNETWTFLSSKDGDLTKLDQVQAAFAKYKPTHVIHLAAKVGGLYGNMAQNLEFYLQNMAINMNVLKVCHETGVKKVVSCLSTCIFPDKTSYPIDETMLHSGEPHTSNLGYSHAKRAVDILSRLYRQDHGCNFVTVIPTNIYGPHDNFHIQGGHVIPGLIHKLYKCKREGTKFTVWGNGTALRQFIYSVDLGKLMVWTMRNYNEAEPIILSVDESDEISIKDAAKAVADAYDYKDEFQYDRTKSDGQHKKTASNNKLRRLYPEFEFTPFAEGVRQSVEWFEANYETARK